MSDGPGSGATDLNLGAICRARGVTHPEPASVAEQTRRVTHAPYKAVDSLGGEPGLADSDNVRSEGPEGSAIVSECVS